MDETINFIIQWIGKNQDFFFIFVSVLFIMIYFAILEWKSFSREQKFKDFKPAIISTGVLGTFIGILLDCEF